MNSKCYLLCALFVVACFGTTAQEKYADCDTKYFKNNKVSTRICYDKDKRKGSATAYDIRGNKIYEMEVRHVYGNASVAFGYYDNGAVKEARYHSAPDAGIQWYNTTTHFAPDGAITGEDHNDYDDFRHPHITTQRTRVPPGKPKTIAYCAIPYATEYWYVNDTKYPVIVVAERKGYAKDTKATVLQPADTAKGGEYIMAEQFVNIGDFYNFSARPVSERVKSKFTIAPLPQPVTMPGKGALRRYYYLVQ